MKKIFENLFKDKENKSFNLETAPPRKGGYPSVPEFIFPSYEENLDTVKAVFNADLSSDIKIREFLCGGRKAFIVFIESMIDSNRINTHILAPMMLIPTDATEETVENSLVVVNQLTATVLFDDAFYSLALGDCIIFVDGVKKAFMCDVKSWERRGVQPPVSEAVIYGPHEGFTENFKTNGALIRKNVRSPDLVSEMLKVGKVSKTPISLMYMKNIANEGLVSEVKRRLERLDTDYIFQLGQLEQFLEDKTFTLTPQFLTTERPDRAAECLIEGKVVILMHGSPFALVCPVTLSEFFTTVEDKYMRFPFANFIKAIRLIAILSSFLLPALYIALINFHIEMIPPDLLFAIEASRESVPFPSMIELLLMELAFDIIREASIRVPSSIGSTLGIIGALIIGQSAVEASLVSPISIIIVAITGIGSFATPNYELNMSFRVLRYIYIFAGALWGFGGIAFCMFIHVAVMSASKSMGAPLFNAFSDFSLRHLFDYPIWKKEKRYTTANPKQTRLQAKISRRWVKK